MDNYYTILGWAVTVTAGGACYYYYSQQDDRRRPFQGRGARISLPRAVATPPIGDGRTRRREERRRVGQGGAQGSGSDTSRQAAITAQAPPATSTKDTSEVDDLRWAQELEKRKRGTNFAPPSRTANKQRTVKQANANTKAAELSAESSSAGAGDEADDDLSPAASPALPGASHEETRSSNNVSDMLEPSAPAPGVLRLTESTNPVRSKPKQQARPTAEQESKKQRQNKKKVEEKKLQREADEKERRALEERQRRTARESRGEAAKNGLGISSAPTSSAWKASNHVVAAPVPAVNGPLLDTFANDTTSTESTDPTSGTSSPVQPKTKENWWKKDIPSEEEQVRILTEQDESSWNTVAAKKTKRKNQDGAVQPVEMA